MFSQDVCSHEVPILKRSSADELAAFIIFPVTRMEDTNMLGF